jgi:hypothetical protein
MPPFKVAPCTLDDATAIAHNNVIAFWQNKYYELMWAKKNKSRDYVLSQAILRWPYNLIKDPEHRRMEKVVDVSTGELVGFANWILPDAGAVEGGENEKQEIGKLWPEALGPEVDDDTRKLLKKRFEDADWEFERAPVTDESLIGLSDRLRGDKKWISECIRRFDAHVNINV